MYHLVDFCRLCLSFKGEFTVMWLDDIMEKVTACISELDFDNNLPLLICNACLEKVDDFFRFRNQCLQSEFFIGGYVNKLCGGAGGDKRNTALKVNVVQNFGTSIKYKSNVSVRKPSEPCRDVRITNCNVYLNDCVKSGQRNSSKITNNQATSVAKEATFSKASKVNRYNNNEANDQVRNSSDFAGKKSNSQLCSVNTDVQNEVVAVKKREKKVIAQSSTAKSSSNITDQTTGVADFLDEDDDIFVEEEDDYSIYEPELVISPGSPGEVVYEDGPLDPNDKEVANFDPENLLIKTRHRSKKFNVQTDLSERVKLHKRNAKAKPVYRLDDFFNDYQDDLPTTQTSTNKKPHTKKPLPKPDKTEESENDDEETPVESKAKESRARKSTSKYSLHLKKNIKVKHSKGNNLWKAACRNWTLQRMQTSGHVSTGRRNSPNPTQNVNARGLNSLSKSPLSESQSVETSDKDICALSNSIEIHHNKGKRPSNVEAMDSTVTTVVNYRDPSGDYGHNNTNADDNQINDNYGENTDDTALDESSRSKSPESVPHLNDLLKRQEVRFNANVCSEYGIVISEDNYAGDGGSPKWTSDNENMRGFQILNTYSLSEDTTWDSVETNTDKNKADFALQENCNVHNKQVISDDSCTSLLKRNLPNVSTEGGAAIKKDTKTNQGIDQIKSPTTETKPPKKYISLTPLKKLQRTPQKGGDIMKGEASNRENATYLPDMADYEEALGSHFIARTSQPIPFTPIPKITVKPARSVETSCKQQKYKIKTTNNIILINPDQMRPANLSEDDERRYQSNFGNLLQHYLNTSPAGQTNTEPQKKKPIKLVLPRSYLSLVKPDSKLKNGICGSNVPAVTQAKIVNSSRGIIKNIVKGTTEKPANVVLIEDSSRSNSGMAEKQGNLNSPQPPYESSCSFSTTSGQTKTYSNTPLNIAVAPTHKTELQTATAKVPQSVNCENQTVKQLSSTQDNTVSSACGVKRRGSCDASDFAKSMRASNENCY